MKSGRSDKFGKGLQNSSDGFQGFERLEDEKTYTSIASVQAVFGIPSDLRWCLGMFVMGLESQFLPLETPLENGVRS